MRRCVVEQVVRAGMCTGCGLCASVLGRERVQMEPTREGFLRPTVKGSLSSGEAKEFQTYCPGISLELRSPAVPVHALWGPVVTVRTGHAADGTARFVGSSGGALSGLLLHMLEAGKADCIVHSAAVPGNPTYTDTVVSRTREEVVAAAGSRYAPTSPLAAIVSILERDERIVFVGKPCDVAGLKSYVRQHPELAQRLILLVSFMCAGTPSDHGTAEILDRLGVKREEVRKFWYRGHGWPGRATAETINGRTLSMDYATSWGTILNKHLQLRCKVCPDGTGEFADVTFADAWHGPDGYPSFEEHPGRSLVVSRSAVGEAAVADAIRGGHLLVREEHADTIEGMQPYQVDRKRYALSRLAAVVVRRCIRPRFKNLRLLRCARQASLVEQLRNFRGTLRRLGSSQSD